MTYYSDLSPCDYFSEADLDLTAIGWLEADHPYTKGPVSDEFLRILANFIPFSRWFFCGLHECSLCQGVYGGVGGFVPGENRIFAFPELLGHYIEVHGYRPPAEFQAALHRCPPTTSDEYFDELERLGMVVPLDERTFFRDFVNRPHGKDYLRQLESLDYSGEEQLLEIFHQLGEFEHEHAVPQLTKVWLEDPRLPVRQAAGQALLSIATPDALHALQQRQGDPDPLSSTLAVLSVFVQNPQTAFDRLPHDASTFQFLRIELWPKEIMLSYIRNKLILRHESFKWFDADPRWLQLLSDAAG